jgi:flagellar FliL protein
MMTAATAAAGPAKAKKGGLLKNKKVILLLLAVLAGGYFAYTMFLKPKPPPGPPVGGDVVTLDPTTLNLADGHYLKVGVAIQLLQGGSATVADFKSAEAEQLIIDEFSNRPMQSLTNATRQRLADDLTKHIKKAYKDEVYTVYLTEFVTQ